LYLFAPARLLWLQGFLAMKTRPLLLGHRGASKYAPENSIAAFDLALEHGCDGFEFDVRYTRDGHPVICHDSHNQRQRIDACLSDELKLPGAEEVVRDYGTRAYLDIELKVSGDAGAVLKALQAVPPDRYIISSFLPEVLKRVNAVRRAAPLGLICETSRQLQHSPMLPIQTVIIESKLLSKSLIEEVHAAGRQVFVWTVNKESEMRSFAELEVDGLISDDTRLLARTFGAPPTVKAGLRV
jgi:glycerophosphoryl diester phosphodiesterase